MIGAIIGDVIGSPYEFCSIKQVKFPLFSERSCYTDDTILSVAICEALMKDIPFRDNLLKWAEMFPSPYGGYGGMFNRWIFSDDHLPYQSFGNGSAMRVSSIGWLFDDIGKVLSVAEQSASVTHDHPEGIKGAQAIAAAVFLARTGKSKYDIKTYIESQFGYDLNRTCDDIRPSYSFDGTCQGSVPEAIIAFLDSNSFENAIRLAVSLGGDSDTLACMAGAIAEAWYQNIPLNILVNTFRKLPTEIWSVLYQFHSLTKNKRRSNYNFFFLLKTIGCISYRRAILYNSLFFN